MANSQNWPSCGSPTRACQAACGAAGPAGGLRFCLVGAHFPISQLVWAPETVTEKLHLRNEFVVPKKGSLFRLSFIMTSDVIHLLKHCKYSMCIYIYISIYLYIYMCVCVSDIILYVYINAYLYNYIYIYIPLYCRCGKPTLHAPHWPGCHSGRRRIGAETWHNWFLGWLVPAARSTGIIYSKKKDLSDPIDSWWLGSTTRRAFGASLRVPKSKHLTVTLNRKIQEDHTVQDVSVLQLETTEYQRQIE